MPELPEVETVCRGLAMKLEGKVLTRVEQRRKDLRFPLPVEFAQRLTGRRIVRIARRAKYMIWELDDGTAVIGHLGMSGRMVLGQGWPEVLEPHDHLIFQAEDGWCLRFNDARRFGMMDLHPLAELDAHKLLKGLGPEPLGNAFNGPSLAASLKGKKTSIKAALLDQKVVAGLGNIYVSEALFRAGISPKRSGPHGARRSRGKAGRRRQGGADRRHRRRRLIVARLCADRRRARLFPEAVAGL